jgi:hypothetical protein
VPALLRKTYGKEGDVIVSSTNEPYVPPPGDCEPLPSVEVRVWVGGLFGHYESRGMTAEEMGISKDCNLPEVKDES